MDDVNNNRRATAEMLKLLAEQAKLNAEQAKFNAEQGKLLAERAKLDAEAVKLQRDAFWQPVAIAAAMMGGTAALLTVAFKATGLMP